MSALEQIKAQVIQIAQTAEALASQLSAYSPEFSTSVAEITQAIGGTATDADKKMTTAFQQADEAVKQAAMDMQLAAQKASEWARNA